MFSILIILLAVVLTSCQSDAERDREKAQQVSSKAAVSPDGSIHLKPEQIQINGIQVTEVAESDVTPSIIATGRVKPRAGGEAQVFSPFAGRLIADPARLPHPGDFVRQGQLVAEVEQQFMASERLQFNAATIQLQASIEQAQQEVDLRRTEVNRAQQLFDGGAIPLKQLQSAQFDLKSAESKLEGARKTKQEYESAQSQANAAPRKAPIVAPISGTVITVDVAAGQQVDPAKSLLTIVDMATVWVEAAVHEKDLASARNAKTADISTPDAAGKRFIGKTVTIGNVVDPENRTVPVAFAVSNPDGIFKIGMFVQVRIPTGGRVQALLIPAAAVLSGQGASSVFVETEPGAYRRKVVTLGERVGDSVVVIDGLIKGEKVVSTGGQTLHSESLKSEIPVEDVGEKR